MPIQIDEEQDPGRLIATDPREFTVNNPDQLISDDPFGAAARGAETPSAGGGVELPELDFTGDGPVAESPGAPELSAPPMVAAEKPVAPTRLMAAGTPKAAAQPELPKVDPSKLDWKGLQQRLGFGRINDELTNGLNASIVGVANQHLIMPPQSKAGEENAADELRLAQARQQMDANDLTQKAKLAAMGASAADRDPNSLQSQKARNSIRAAFPGIQLPEGFDNWSAADIKQFVNTGALQNLALRQANARKEQIAAEDRQSKIRSETEKNERAASELGALRELAKTKLPGIDVSKLSPTDIRKLLDDKEAKERAWIMAHQKKEAGDDKKTEGLPYGIELKPDANPSTDQKKDLSLADRGVRDVHKLADAMRVVLDRASLAGRFVGDDSRELDQIAAEMTIAAKNAGGLGQITAGDSALINAIRPNATDPKSAFRNRQSFERQLRGLEKWADDKFQAGLESIGAFRRPSSKGPLDGGAPGAGSGPRTSGAKKIRSYLVSPDGKRRVPVYEDGSRGQEEAAP